MSGNTFEALFRRGGTKDDAKKTIPPERGASDPEKEGSGLETATNIKKEISEIAQGRSLGDLPSEDLKMVLKKYKEMGGALGLSESEPKGDVREQMLRAKEIMGEDFFAPEQIEKAFGIKVRPEHIPAIPFKREDLERAKELDQFLILRVDKTSDGKPLTMEKMNELLRGKVSGGAKALFSDDGSGKIKDDAWYKSEAFATQETPRLSWALVSKDVIPGSAGKNYLEQTSGIAAYLRNEVFKGKALPAEFQSAISEFEKTREEIGTLIGTGDWQKAAEKLEGLAITKLARQAPAEALYDLLVYFQNRGERLLENTYTWTSKRSFDGSLVYVGSFDAKGAHVYRLAPHDRYGALGVSFSRSV